MPRDPDVPEASDAHTLVVLRRLLSAAFVAGSVAASRRSDHRVQQLTLAAGT